MCRFFLFLDVIAGRMSFAYRHLFNADDCPARCHHLYYSQKTSYARSKKRRPTTRPVRFIRDPPDRSVRMETTVRLHQGENVIGIRAEHPRGVGAVLVHLTLGGVKTIVSDASWRYT
jgi:hypothetical protein